MGSTPTGLPLPRATTPRPSYAKPPSLLRETRGQGLAGRGPLAGPVGGGEVEDQLVGARLDQRPQLLPHRVGVAEGRRLLRPLLTHGTGHTLAEAVGLLG